MKLALTEHFQRDVRNLGADRKAALFEAMLSLAMGEPHQHSGPGIRKLHRSGIWEARVGLGLRLVFTLELESPDLGAGRCSRRNQKVSSGTLAPARRPRRCAQIIGHARFPFEPKRSAMATTKPGLDLDLEAFWMPFTANRQFKANPRLLVAAEGMHYTAEDGRKILDATCRPLVRERGARAKENHRGDSEAGRGARFRAWLPDGTSRCVPTRPSARGDRSAAAEARLLHELGLRVRGHGAQDRSRLSPGSR